MKLICKNCKKFDTCSNKLSYVQIYEIQNDEIVFWAKDSFFYNKFYKKFKLKKEKIPKFFEYVASIDEEERILMFDPYEYNSYVFNISTDDNFLLNSEEFNFILSKLKEFEKEFCPMFFERTILE
jgi:hypothetical protein